MKCFASIVRPAELAARFAIKKVQGTIKAEKCEGKVVKMTRRLYFVLPNADSAKAMFKEMQQAHVDKVQFLGKRGGLPPELPEASVVHDNDITRAAKRGILTGGLIGVMCGEVAVLFPPDGLTFEPITVPLIALLGALMGIWIASMMGDTVSNTKFEGFQSEIEQDKVLMIVDVSPLQIEEVSARASRNPKAVLRGLDETAMLSL